jgi:peptidyl-tRNA hydrolase
MASASDTAPPPDPLMQYIVLRRDMWGGGGPGAPAGAPWPLGAVAAQAAHAATAALWESRGAADTVAYCTGDALNHMTKVVLEVADGAALADLAARLGGAGVAHRVWTELPEGVPTAVASAPGRKSVLQPHFKAGKLCRVGIGGGKTGA